jgi:hypothetical protein
MRVTPDAFLTSQPPPRLLPGCNITSQFVLSTDSAISKGATVIGYLSCNRGGEAASVGATREVGKSVSHCANPLDRFCHIDDKRGDRAGAKQLAPFWPRHLRDFTCIYVLG